MTGSSAAVAVTSEQLELGEGLRWDARRDELLRLDILAGRVFRDTVDPHGDLVPVAEYHLPVAVGAIAPIDGDDGWLLAAGRGLWHLAPDGSHRHLVDLVAEGVRMNDATCDPQGRLWAGSMAEDHRAGGGSLLRVERDGRVDLVLDELTIPNGAGWSPDGRTMYFIDSVPGQVHAFDFDGERGEIGAARVIVDLTDEPVGPDGMTVDAGGDLWIALYGGGQVRRYTAEGAFREAFHVPAEQSTSCAFAGPRLDHLYVTTATEFWTDEQRAASPAAGLVHRIDAVRGVTGRPASPFRPDPAWWARVAA